MGEPNRDPVQLFSYGTLRDSAVQLANFGRLLAGRADSLRSGDAEVRCEGLGLYWRVSLDAGDIRRPCDLTQR